MISSVSANTSAEPRRQYGGVITTILAVLLPLAVAAWLGVRVVPAWSQYHAVEAALDAVAASPGTATLSRNQIYLAVLHRAGPGVITDMTPDDLEIHQEPGRVVLHVAYSSVIPLFGRYSLLVDFAHDSPEPPVSP